MGEKYYFNLETGEVEFGRRARGMNRMGPYDSIDEARNALSTAKERTDSWDEDDAQWRDDGAPWRSDDHES